MSDSGKAAYINLVEKGIQTLKAEALQKVVLSRRIRVNLATKPVEIFKNVLHSYSTAFCYLFFHPSVGLWCGATPETLVHIKGQQLNTMALAATLPVNGYNPLHWTTKELEEQGMVVDDIREKLSPIVEQLQIEKTKPVKAGNLWHLHSKVQGTLLPGITTKQVIKALHPTAAVCGIPDQKAKAFIQQHENYQRTFYSGFLGELNLNNPNEASLFVNLRCMELEDNQATLFVGAGITSASDPESEWIETQHKSKTLLNVL